MFKIHQSENSISRLRQVSFKELKVTERKNLQEWIAKTPDCLGEDLLIIQKEFSGFQDTNERLDLLALDKDGNLVVIENKLDDSGKDVTWQAIKYTSYCSALSFKDIIDIYQQYLSKIGSKLSAEEKLEEFFETPDYEALITNIPKSQRVILVAGEFQKEVTSAVIYLMSYGLKIKCFKAKPFLLDKQALVTFEQIIPLVGTEDLIIKMSNKAKVDLDLQKSNQNRYEVRFKFWNKFLSEINSKNILFQGLAATKESWIGKGAGKTGINYEIVVNKNGIRMQVYFNTGNKALNKDYFNQLYSQKDAIEKSFGHKLNWFSSDEKVTAKIYYEYNGGSVFIEQDWDKLVEFVKENITKFEVAFKSPINALKQVF